MILYYSGVPSGFMEVGGVKKYYRPEEVLPKINLMLSYAIQLIRKDERMRLSRIFKQRKKLK